MTSYLHDELLALLKIADLSDEETANQVQAMLYEETTRQKKEKQQAKIKKERLMESRDDLITAVLNHMDTIIEVYSDDNFDIEAICSIDTLAQYIEKFVKASEKELAPKIQRMLNPADKTSKNTMKEDCDDDDIIQHFLKDILS